MCFRIAPVAIEVAGCAEVSISIIWENTTFTVLSVKKCIYFIIIKKSLSHCQIKYYNICFKAIEKE